MEKLTHYLPIHHHIYSTEQGYLERMSEFCMQPVTYMMGDEGRVVTIFSNGSIRDEVAFAKDRRSLLSSTVATISFVPGYLFGQTMRTLAKCIDPSIAKREELARKALFFTINGVEIPEVDRSFSLSELYEEFERVKQKIYDYLQTYFPTMETFDGAIVHRDINCQNYNPLEEKVIKIWQDETLLTLADEAMFLMVFTSQRLFEKNRPLDADKCASLSLFYHHLRENCYPVLSHEKQVLYLPILEDTFVNETTGEKITLNKPECDEPYFNPLTRQYRWRQYYNFFCREGEKANAPHLHEYFIPDP